MDVAPLQAFKEHRQPFIGRPAFVAPGSVSDAVTRLESMAGKIEYLSRYRGQVLRAVVIAQILTYSAVLVVLIVSTFLPDWAVRTLQLGLLLLIILPFGLALEPAPYRPAILRDYLFPQNYDRRSASCGDYLRWNDGDLIVDVSW